jgi:coproporphyrinogen III oxidase
MDKELITKEFRSLQLEICHGLEQEDGKARFAEDAWTREEGGGGFSRIISHGNYLEKGGVNFSAVHGPVPAFLSRGEGSMKSDTQFYATGVSIVLHPQNPQVPIIHMNIRYFESSDGKWWFGGGIDLTPHYVNPDDARLFHTVLKNTCDQFDNNYYPRFKTWADDYFFIKHRNETRGIGGIFFDHLNEQSEGKTKEHLFEFTLAVGKTFLSSYLPIVQKNKSIPALDEHFQWQKIRRGRYVEFNLVYDRGTKFGLETNGRIESILMSLPPQADWLYNHQPAEGSEEARSLSYLKKGIKWV